MTDGTAVWAIRDKRNRHNVGDIVIKDTTPKDYEYLIAMDGQTFDTTKYPFLAELYPSGTLPNLNDNRFLEGAETAGVSKGAGLPNITAYIQTWSSVLHSENIKDTSRIRGAFYISGSTAGAGGTNVSSSLRNGLAFDASLSNSIYGNSDTVQPKSYTVKYYVCYA